MEEAERPVIITPEWRAAATGSSSDAARRITLQVVANPAPWHDYRVRWAGALPCGTRLRLDYVPDRLILASDGLTRYLKEFDRERWPVLETLVVAVLDDLNNELVPRWLRVAATRQAGTFSHHAVADDRQPEWNNPGLLSRLESGRG